PRSPLVPLCRYTTLFRSRAAPYKSASARRGAPEVSMACQCTIAAPASAHRRASAAHSEGCCGTYGCIAADTDSLRPISITTASFLMCLPPASRATRPVLQSADERCTSCGEGRAVKFGLFFEHQVPRPWADGDEQRVFGEALEQIELADRLGFDCAWL